RNFMPDARAGSLRPAARGPRPAQPAVSGQIEKLEHELGVPLFSRHGRGIRLSTAGSVLPDRAEAIAQPAQETGEKIRKDRSPARSRFSVGAPPASGRLLVPPFAERLQKTWPQTALHIREGGVSSLLEWVTGKRRDPALLHHPPRLKAFILGPFRPNACRWSLRRRTSQDPPLVQDLAHPRPRRLAVILPNMAHTERRLVEHAALEHGVQLCIKIEADSVSFAKATVDNRLGYTILAFAAMQDEVTRGALTAYPVLRSPLSTRVAIVALRDQHPVTLTQHASAMLHDVCRAPVRQKIRAGAVLI
ncbi:MAG: LysR family transcriptional regulator, partial [Pseudolabrys sp.]|nr:LysR family transcriptional regulator [Pseudolabrys sp.]